MAMTEEQIERRVCVMMDALDRRYLRSDMSDQEYKREVDAIDAWAQAKRGEG